jgi:hypothetical protein
MTPAEPSHVGPVLVSGSGPARGAGDLADHDQRRRIPTPHGGRRVVGRRHILVRDGRSHPQGAQPRPRPRCTIAVSMRESDLVLEGDAQQVTDPPIVAAMAERWAAGGWPCRVDETGRAHRRVQRRRRLRASLWLPTAPLLAEQLARVRD